MLKFSRIGPWHLFRFGRRALLNGTNKLSESLGAATIMRRANKRLSPSKRAFLTVIFFIFSNFKIDGAGPVQSRTQLRF